MESDGKGWKMMGKKMENCGKNDGERRKGMGTCREHDGK